MQGKKNAPKPKRCPQCGAMIQVWPEDSEVCYGCQIEAKRLSGTIDEPEKLKTLPPRKTLSKIRQRFNRS